MLLCNYMYAYSDVFIYSICISWGSISIEAKTCLEREALSSFPANFCLFFHPSIHSSTANIYLNMGAEENDEHDLRQNSWSTICCT